MCLFVCYNVKSTAFIYSARFSWLIVSAPWYFTNETLLKDLRIPTVDQLAKLYYNRFHSKLQHHLNP